MGRVSLPHVAGCRNVAAVIAEKFLLNVPYSTGSAAPQGTGRSQQAGCLLFVAVSPAVIESQIRVSVSTDKNASRSGMNE